MGALTQPPEERRGPGTYILVLRLAGARSIRVGRLGEYPFLGGYYLYVGSALGGLWGRLNRHLRATKRPHWHIDYLLEHAIPIEVWYILSPERLECAWARALANLERISPFEAPFGASDCLCRTHLFYTPQTPMLREIAPHLPYGEAVHTLIIGKVAQVRVEEKGQTPL